MGPFKSYGYQDHTLVVAPSGCVLVHSGSDPAATGPLLHRADSLQDAMQWVDAARQAAALADPVASMRSLLAEAVGYRPLAFDRDEAVDGADLVDWFARWRLRARRALEDETGEHTQGDVA